MIFGVVGTHEARMDRLVLTLDSWAATHSDEVVVIQAGTAARLVKHAQAVPYASEDQIQRWLEEAAVVVTHGGPSLLLALVDRGRHPIVMPRERRYGEHVDDHQVAFAEFLVARHLIVLVRTPAALLEALEHPDPGRLEAAPLPPLDLPSTLARFEEQVRSLF